MEGPYKVQDFLKQDEILCQLAEECGELAQAALKLRRVLTDVNPTPVGYKQAAEDLNEEIADVRLCVELLQFTDEEMIRKTRNRKLARWITRLMERAERDG